MKKLFCRFAAAALAVSVMFCLSSCKSGEQEQKPEQGGETTLSLSLIHIYLLRLAA